MGFDFYFVYFCRFFYFSLVFKYIYWEYIFFKKIGNVSCFTSRFVGARERGLQSEVQLEEYMFWNQGIFVWNFGFRNFIFIIVFGKSKLKVVFNCFQEFVMRRKEFFCEEFIRFLNLVGKILYCFEFFVIILLLYIFGFRFIRQGFEIDFKCGNIFEGYLELNFFRDFVF